MKNNRFENNSNSFYYAGFFIILLLPLLILPPFFSPTDWGKTLVFRSIISIILFLFSLHFLNKRKELNLPEVKKNKTIWILTALFLFYFLATIFSVDVSFSLWGTPYRSGGFVNFAFYILFAILAFLLLKKQQWEKLLDLSIITGILVSALAIVQYFGMFSSILVAYDGRPPSTMGNPIILGIYLVIMFFIALPRAIADKNRGKKLFYFASCLLFLLVILLSGSRASYLGLLAAGLFFVLFYPKKIPAAKITIIVGLALVAALVFYVNTQTKFPAFLENSRIFKQLQQRLSIDLFLIDPRFSAWQITSSVIKEKPILGWGPENFAIGFDKYYDPSLPFISKDWGGWWDRPHNFVLDIAATAGIPALIVYLFLLGFIVWQMQKIKKSSPESSIAALGVQAAIIGYFVSNFFFFDTFATYLMIFFLVGYSMRLIENNKETQENYQIENIRPNLFTKSIPVATGIVVFLFIWQYNLVPMFVNANINRSDDLIMNSKCDEAFSLMDKTIKNNKSILDGYVRGQYVDQIKKCADLYKEKNLDYAKRGIEVLEEATKMHPMNTRYWIFLGGFTTIKSSAEQDEATRNALLENAKGYFEKAMALAPNHQEAIIELAKVYLVLGQYDTMKQKAEECIKKEDSLGECYLIKALSEIYLNQQDEASNDIMIADDKRFDTGSIHTLSVLANAYAQMEKYKELAVIYRKLIKLNNFVPQYHSSLAFVYYKLNNYEEAREEAETFLKMMPEAKEEVETFLNMLPKQ